MVSNTSGTRGAKTNVVSRDNKGSNVSGKTLMNKFNPFVKRNKGVPSSSIQNMDDQFIIGEHQKFSPTKEEIKGSNIMSPEYKSGHNNQTRYKKSPRVSGDSFIEIYDDTEFEDLGLEEIITRLERNLDKLNVINERLRKDIATLRKKQIDLTRNSEKRKDLEKEERKYNEEMDYLISQQYNLKLQKKSLEELLKVLRDKQRNDIYKAANQNRGHLHICVLKATNKVQPV